MRKGTVLFTVVVTILAFGSVLLSSWVRTWSHWHPPYPPPSEGVVDITARRAAEGQAGYLAFAGKEARVIASEFFVCKSVRFAREGIAGELWVDLRQWPCSRVKIISIREIEVRKRSWGFSEQNIDIEVENESGERAHVISWYVEDPVGELLKIFAFEDEERQ